MWTIIALTSVVIGLIHWFLTSPYGYWRSKGVPNPPPTLLLGNLGPSITLKKNLGQVYKEIYDEYKDLLYVGYYKFRKPGILLRDMDLIKDVLVKEFSSFHDNDIKVIESVDPMTAKNPFCLTGNKWKATRSLVTSSITHSKIKNMFNLINKVGDNMIKYLEAESETCEKDGLEVKDLASKYTTDAVATYAFGLDVKSFEDPNSEFMAMGKKFLSPTFWTGIKHMLMFILPQFANILHLKFIPDEVEKWFTNMLKETINYRVKNNIVRHDYLDLLISLKSKPTQYGFTDQDVMAQAMTFYGDGYETSSIALSFTLYEIAAHPEIQTKLREEIKTVQNKYNGELTYEAILEMTYLEMVFSESLRKNAPVLFMVRLCTKQYDLPSPKGQGKGPNIVIKPGTPMVIPILAIHKDPAIYTDPETFDPERFTAENIQSRPKYSFLAFGEGPRICLGSRFALAQTKAAIARIISNFDIKVNKKTIEPIQLDPKYIMACATGGLWLNFTKITK